MPTSVMTEALWELKTSVAERDIAAPSAAMPVTNL